MIAIIDYGVGNLFSLCCSLKKIGAQAVVTADPEVIEKADKLILPGVGALPMQPKNYGTQVLARSSAVRPPKASP